jgi:vacuolar protein sorting-associated protein 45
MSGNLSKHVTLSCEVSKLVEERLLMSVSKVE